MMTRMIRPCTLWGETFNAESIVEIQTLDNYVRIHIFRHKGCLWYPIDSPCVKWRAQRDEFLKEAITTIANARNLPIQVTQAVLDAMNKVPEAQFWHVEGSVNTRLKWNDALKTFTVNGQTLSITDYIQADCPLALEVLLQFYTDGTPVVVQ